MKSPKPNIIWDSSEYAGDEVMYYSCIDNNDLIVKYGRFLKVHKKSIAQHLMALWPNITFRRFALYINFCSIFVRSYMHNG